MQFPSKSKYPFIQKQLSRNNFDHFIIFISLFAPQGISHFEVYLMAVLVAEAKLKHFHVNIYWKIAADLQKRLRLLQFLQIFIAAKVSYVMRDCGLLSMINWFVIEQANLGGFLVVLQVLGIFFDEIVVVLLGTQTILSTLGLH